MKKLILVVLLGGISLAWADEPGAMRKERWSALTEVQFAELKAAEDLYARKQWKAARNAYEKFQTVHTRCEAVVYCQLMMGEVVRLSGKPNDAVSDFQMVRDLAPDSDDAKWAHLRIGQCYKESGNFEKALATFMDIWKAADTHPTAFWAAAEWMDVLEGQSKHDQLPAVWQQLVERFEKNRIDPKVFNQAAGGLARARVAELDFDGAIKYLGLIVRDADVMPMLVATCKSVAAEIEGVNVRKLNKHKEPSKEDTNAPQVKARREKVAKLREAAFAKAWAWLAEKPRREQHRTVTYACLGLLIDAGKYEDAISRAIELRKIYSDEEWTFDNLCAMLKNLDRLPEAVAQASAARKIHNNNDWSLNLYASLALKAGNLEPALAAWDMMKDKKAGLTASSDALIAVRLPEAVARRRKISEMDPKESTAVFMWIGKVYEKSNRFEEAIKEYHQAANEPTNLYAVAGCLSKLRKHREAILLYGEIGASFEKEIGNAVYLAALEYEMLGDSDTAIRLLRRVCRAYAKVAPRRASEAHVRLANKYHIEETLGGDSGKDPDAKDIGLLKPPRG